MHRDTKLGLALGMLVIGFTVAFCFPRVTPSIHRPVAENLTADPALEFLPIRAYEMPVAAGPQKPTAEIGTAELKLVPVVGVFNEPDGEPGREKIVETKASSPTSESNSLIASSPVATTIPVDVPDAPTVQPGDTLSGIATRYLGSSRRYYEIFEANQDVLSTPDAIKIGMVLRIPGGGESAAPTSQPQPTLAERTPPAEVLVPIPAPYVSEANSRRYHVQPGDTLEQIALRHYGTTEVIPRLRKANPAVPDSLKLQIGSVLELPVVR